MRKQNARIGTILVGCCMILLFGCATSNAATHRPTATTVPFYHGMVQSLRIVRPDAAGFTALDHTYPASSNVQLLYDHLAVLPVIKGSRSCPIYDDGLVYDLTFTFTSGYVVRGGVMGNCDIMGYTDTPTLGTDNLWWSTLQAIIGGRVY